MHALPRRSSARRVTLRNDTFLERDPLTLTNYCVTPLSKRFRIVRGRLIGGRLAPPAARLACRTFQNPRRLELSRQRSAIRTPLTLSLCLCFVRAGETGTIPLSDFQLSTAKILRLSLLPSILQLARFPSITIPLNRLPSLLSAIYHLITLIYVYARWSSSCRSLDPSKTLQLA